MWPCVFAVTTSIPTVPTAVTRTTGGSKSLLRCSLFLSAAEHFYELSTLALQRLLIIPSTPLAPNTQICSLSLNVAFVLFFIFSGDRRGRPGDRYGGSMVRANVDILHMIHKNYLENICFISDQRYWALPKLMPKS